jgi:hypothetical protein
MLCRAYNTDIQGYMGPHAIEQVVIGKRGRSINTYQA